MELMSVTLDVSSKFSNWLNAVARCRVEGRADDKGRCAGREAGGRVRQRRRERRALSWGLEPEALGGHGAHAKRT